jgi:hypothetical protein
MRKRKKEKEKIQKNKKDQFLIGKNNACILCGW